MAMTLLCPNCGNRWVIQKTNYDYACPACTALKQLLDASYQRGQDDARTILRSDAGHPAAGWEPFFKLDCSRCGHRWQVTVAESYDRRKLMCPNGCDHAEAPKRELTREEAARLAMGVYATQALAGKH